MGKSYNLVVIENAYDSSVCKVVSIGKLNNKDQDMLMFSSPTHLIKSIYMRSNCVFRKISKKVK